MQLSVVVPTLNARDRLATTLDVLTAHAPDAEVVVVNGPSADGTSGMVRDREDVDMLVEVSDRTLNVSRNAGIRAASGDVIALLRHDLAVEESWVPAIEAGLARAPVVTGPVHETLPAGMTTTTPERRDIRGREVTYFNGGNVAFRAEALDRLDGFDEYLETGGARDVLAGDATPTNWFGTGRDVVVGIATGYSDGLVARARDRSPTRNPHGCSKRADRAVATYDRR